MLCGQNGCFFVFKNAIVAMCFSKTYMVNHTVAIKCTITNVQSPLYAEADPGDHPY